MKKINKEICLFAILGALLFAFKLAMSFLPNIEPVSLLLIIYTITFGFKSLYPLTVYIFLEIFIYGFGFWSIAYLYIWLILVVAVVATSKITKNSQNALLWASVSGAFGLIFGALYIPLYVISGGFTFAITWWINGLIYDAIHCIANFVLCLILFKPILRVFLKLNREERIS